MGRFRLPPVPRAFWPLAAFLLALWAATAFGQSSDAVSATDLTWHDDARNRDVPVRIYAPASSDGPLPVVLFSHGLGGSREHYAYLGRYWAAHGYVAVHVQHHGSDTETATSTAALQAAMRDPKNYVDRPRDISFALDRLTALNEADGPWKGRLDLAKVGMAGHSFGAYTTMAIAGTTFPLPSMKGLADPRIKAAIAMSTPHLQGADYSGVRIPVLHFTGTEDHIRIAPSDDIRYRRTPFDASPGPDTYLAIFAGGDHMVFSGRRQSPLDTKIEDLVCRGSTAFWDAYLKGDAQARTWLADGGFKEALGASATFEKK